MKTKKRSKEYLKKKPTKEVVEYFPRGGEDFSFNTAIIKRGQDSETVKFLSKKRKAPTPKIEDPDLESSIPSNVHIDDSSGNASSRALFPRFKCGDLVLLSISEVRKDYMIGNYTRNKKAMVHSSYSGFEMTADFSFQNLFRVGQFICGAVVSPGNDIQLPNGRKNKKILVSIDPKIVNTGMRMEKLVIGMDLYGKLIKGKDGELSADFRFRDSEEEMIGFNSSAKLNTERGEILKDMDEYENEDEDEREEEEEEEDEDEDEDEEVEDNENEEEEDIDIAKHPNPAKKQRKDTSTSYHREKVILIDTIESPEILSSKIINSYYLFKLINIDKPDKNSFTLTVSLNHQKYKFPIKSLDFQYLRPGFLFKTNTTRDLLNGVELAFGGNIGTVFVDHIKSKGKAKNIYARVIHLSLEKKAASLSTLKHLISLEVDHVDNKQSIVGKYFKGNVIETLYGGSYLISLKKDGLEEEEDESLFAFLHNNNLDDKEKVFTVGEDIGKVLVKEYNFFDDKPIITAKKAALETNFELWENMNVGKIIKCKILQITSDGIIVTVNNFIEGKIPKEHISDYPLSKIPKKFKIDMEITARVFESNYSTKKLILTMKESLMHINVKLAKDYSELCEGEEIFVVYIGKGLFQHSNSILGKLINFKKKEIEEKLKIGKLYTYKVYKVNPTMHKLFLTNESEVWQPGVGDYDTHLRRNQILLNIARVLNEKTSESLPEKFEGTVQSFQIILPKKLIKLLTKKGIDASLINENKDAIENQYLVAKMTNENGCIYGFIPKELVSDFHTEKFFKLYSSTKMNPMSMLVLYYNKDTHALFITPKRSLIENKDSIIAAGDSFVKDQYYYGYVSKKTSQGIIVQFYGKRKVLMRLKEEEMNSGYDSGQTVICRSNNKKFAFDIWVYGLYSNEMFQQEWKKYMDFYINDMKYLMSMDTSVKEIVNGMKINSIIEGKVGLIKDYGVLIRLVVSSLSITGFLKNEHMKSVYKVDDVGKFRIIDVDPIAEIVYLTDQISDLHSHAEHDITIGQKVSLIADIFHETHITAHIEDNLCTNILIPCNLFNFNYVESSQFSELFKIGCKIESQITKIDSSFIIADFPNKLYSKIKQTTNKRKKPDNPKNSIVVGGMISGRINGVKGNYIYVYIDKNTLGKIHTNNFSRNFEEIKTALNDTSLGQKRKSSCSSNTSNASSHLPSVLAIKAKIIHIETKRDVRICELSCFDNEETIQKINLSVSKELDISGEIPNIGVIAGINNLNKYSLKIDIGTPDVNVRIHFSHLPVEKITQDGLLFKIGDKIEFYSIQLNGSYIHSLMKFSECSKAIEIGKRYPVRVLKTISGRGCIVGLSPIGELEQNHTEAFVDITDITDFLHPNPLKFFKKGQITIGRVMKFDSKANKYLLSLRSSITTSEEDYSIIKEGSTLKFNERFGHFEKICDLRNKILKFGAETAIEQSTVVLGYVTSSSEKGVFIKISNDTIVRASMRELTDDKTSKPFLLYHPDMLVICRVISIYKKNNETPQKINVSLRESVVKYNLTLRTKGLLVNNFYDCIIMNENNEKFEVTVIGSTFTGILKKKNISQHSLSLIKPKAQVILQMIKLDKNNHPPKIRFSNKAIDNQETFDRSIVINALSEEDKKRSMEYYELYHNVKMINENEKQKEMENQLINMEKMEEEIDFEKIAAKEQGNENEEEEEEEGKVTNKAEQGIEENEEVEDEKEEEEEREMLNLEEDVEDNDLIIQHDIKAQLIKNFGKKNKEAINEKMIIDEKDVDNSITPEENKKCNSSKKREKEHLKEELKIRSQETEQEEITEKNAEYYEKLILSNHDSSFHWIQYASYILDTLNLTAARKIFERAITTINISKIKEKINIWVAYMNLENLYGNQETFKSVVERALEVNEKKIIYKHLISIYKSSFKFDLANEVYKILTKSYFADFDVWKSFVQFLFEAESFSAQSSDQIREKMKGFSEPKEGLNKALQVLPKKRHVDILIWYGQLLYQFSRHEEARNTFESILKSIPKRSDIWLVYLDKELKHTKNIAKMRNIYDKIFKVDLKVKTLKTMIKKYLEFEKEFGDDTSFEDAKERTHKIIQEKLMLLEHMPQPDEKMEVDEEEENENLNKETDF